MREERKKEELYILKQLLLLLNVGFSLIKTINRTHALPYMMWYERTRIFTEPQVWLYA